jgi:tmRNA-binding protein
MLQPSVTTLLSNLAYSCFSHLMTSKKLFSHKQHLSAYQQRITSTYYNLLAVKLNLVFGSPKVTLTQAKENLEAKNLRLSI